jgi:hypothetical protein
VSTVDVNAVMDALGVRLATIAGLRVYDYRADNVAAPAAIVGLPTAIDYDGTKGRGSDRLVVPVVVLVGRVSDRASRDLLSAYIAGAGARSVKAAIEGAIDLGGAAQTTRVTSAVVAEITVANVVYIGVTFDCEVIS